MHPEESYSNEYAMQGDSVRMRQGFFSSNSYQGSATVMLCLQCCIRNQNQPLEPLRIAPEVQLKKEYDGKIADVWSCGVTLYVMLVGAYPFGDPEEPKNFRKTIQRISNVHYSIPDYVHVSSECRHLISRTFVADPAKRITMAEIRNHEWLLKNLPTDLTDESTMNNQFEEPEQPMQSDREIVQIIAEATIPAAGTNSLNQYLAGSLDIDDDMDEDLESDDDLDTDSSGEIVRAV